MHETYICDGIRTPIGRYGGALSQVRPDDLAAIVLRTLRDRNSRVDWDEIANVCLGCVNQAGEDNRNVGRMSSLLAGFSTAVPGNTINRLCGSGMDAVITTARMLQVGDADLAIAGGVESMSRAPFVIGKSDTAFGRRAEMHDSTIGWRFVNPRMQELYGTESMPETAENVALEYGISRIDQDLFAARSHRLAVSAQKSGRFASEIVPVSIAQKRGAPLLIEHDEHPRADTTVEKLSTLSAVSRPGGSVTAGNASGVNDGACALLLASAEGVRRHSLTPRARIVASAIAGVEPRVMGIGPVPASRRALSRAGLEIGDIDVFEFNEAFAAQCLAVSRTLGIADNAEHLNPNGGAIALGHPLGMSGARLILTATEELHRRKARYALCSMCIGIGQGIAIIIERV